MAEGAIQTEAEIKSQLPTGEAKKIKYTAKRNWSERLLLFSQVKNKVLETNPLVNSPFNLEEGEPTPLGVFAQAVLKEKPRQSQQGQIPLEVLPQHMRAALLARVIFKDNVGNLYRDVDIKGVGFLTKGNQLVESYKPAVSKPGIVHSLGGRYGLLDQDTARFDYVNGEELSQAGVRVARTLAIIELQELIVNGRKISLAQARKRGIIDEDFRPVIEVRAFGTNARIRDLTDPSWIEHSKRVGLPHVPDLLTYEKTSDLLLEDAKKLVAQELGKDSISNDEYLDWFAETLGKNVALIHKQGILHGYLHDQNITLDCRIVDFDGETQITSMEEYKEEMEIVRNAIKELLERVSKSSYVSKDDPRLFLLLQKFARSYDTIFKSAMFKRFLNKAERERLVA